MKNETISGCCASPDRELHASGTYASDLGICPDCGQHTTFIEWQDGTKSEIDRGIIGQDVDRECYCGHPESKHVMEMWNEGGFAPHEVCKTYERGGQCLCGVFELPPKSDPVNKLIGTMSVAFAIVFVCGMILGAVLTAAQAASLIAGGVR